MLDVRVSRLIAWLRSNFLASRIELRFVTGEFNTEADILSRWKVIPKDVAQEDQDETMDDSKKKI